MEPAVDLEMVLDAREDRHEAPLLAGRPALATGDGRTRRSAIRQGPAASRLCRQAAIPDRAPRGDDAGGSSRSGIRALVVPGIIAATHRDRRGARGPQRGCRVGGPARPRKARGGAYRAYVTDEQRRGTGCIAGRMLPQSCSGPLSQRRALIRTSMLSGRPLHEVETDAMVGHLRDDQSFHVRVIAGVTRRPLAREPTG